MFGGDRARDLQVAGQQLGQASESLAALYERTARDANDNRVQDLNNQFLDGRREILRTGPDAYYSRQGAAAIAGADAASGRLTALKDRLLDQTGNGYQRQQLGRILDLHLAASAEGIADHVAAQQDVYNRGVAAAAIRTAQAEATADPSVMAQATMRAEDAARVVHAGQPPEAVEAGVRAAAGSLVAGVIGDRLARNDVEGIRLLRQHGDRLDPTVRSTLGAAAEMLSNGLTADAWLRERSATLPAPTGDATLDAVNAASASPDEPPPVLSSGGTLLDPDGGIVGTRQRLAEIDERRRALTALNRQEFAADPARLRANQVAIDVDSVRRGAALKADTDSLYAGLRRHLTTGGPAVTPPPATIMSRLTDAQQDAVTAQVNAAIAGRQPTTDPQTWYAIRQGLTADDAGERQRWASASLVPFMGRLSPEDYAALETQQTIAREDGAGQRRLQAIARMADEALRSIGIDPAPRPDAPPGSDAAQAAMFHRAVQDELTAFESRGHAPTEAEAYGIVTNLKDTAIGSGWLRVRDASPTVMSDYPSTDEAFHEDGAQIAQAQPDEQRPGAVMRLAPDYETFRRRMEEARQREAAERAAAGAGGAPGAPAPEPDPGSFEFQTADEEARAIADEQVGEEPVGHPMAPATEQAPGSPEYRAAEEQARKLGEGDWDNLGIFKQLGIAFQRFDQESRRSGAALSVDSSARHLERVLELQRRQDAGEELNVTEKKYLLKNRKVAPDLAAAVGRLVDAQHRLDELPASDPLRQLFEAPSVAEAARLLRQNPGRIARAIGVEGVPALTVSLIATAVLGPLASAIALTGTSGLDGYAKGLLGALARAGVDVSDADDLIDALQDSELMQRVRKDATTEGAIAAGMSAAAIMIPIPKSSKRAPISLVMQVPESNAKGRGFESFRKFKEAIGKAPPGYAWHHIVGQTAKNIKRFGAKRIHNTNNLVLVPNGRGKIHNRISAIFESTLEYSKNMKVRNWIGRKSFKEQAEFGRRILDDARKELE